MDTLHKNLLYVKDLITAMGNLNGEEEKLLRQKRIPIRAQQVVLNKPKQNKGTLIVILLLIFAGLFFVNTAPYALSSYRSEKVQLELDKTNDKFSWELHHPKEEKYPGYQGRDSVNWVNVFVPASIRGFIISFVITGIIAAIMASVRKKRDASVDERNRQMKMNYETVLRNNEIILQKNAEVDEQLKQINNKRTLISKEYLQSIITWYPKDYAYLSAVNYFINQVENHMANTIQECVEQYNTYLFRQQITENQQAMLNNQIVMINNQRVMISKQEEMVRQQMIGNAIATVSMMANVATANNTRNIANSAANTERHAGNIANSAASTAQHAASTARHTGNIARSAEKISKDIHNYTR